MSEIAVRNARIKGASIVIDDYGCLTVWLDLDYGGSGQGFGGYALHLPDSFVHADKRSPYCGHFILRVLQITEVDDWSKVPGKTIRVRAEHSRVHAIGHIVNDDWFDPKADFAEMAA